MKPYINIKNNLCLMFLLATAQLCAQWQLTGKVRSSEGALMGVAVVEKGTANGTLSDEKGEYVLNVKPNATLIFSLIGYHSKEVQASAASLEVFLDIANTLLIEKIVTATRQPVRKMEATTAVSTVGMKQLESLKPDGVAEAIRGVPGMYTRNSQGRFRGAIFTRGFPDGTGNGLVYTGILMDGIPCLATTSRPPDFAMAFDPNIERVEVVRGAAATLFGHGSAAGVVNMINRTGGENHAGMVRTTFYNSNVTEHLGNYSSGIDYKIEANVNGALTKDKKVRYNLGGYYLYDKGFRNMGYADRGGQVRGNIDYLFKDAKVRAFFHLTDMTIQNMIDIPFRLSDWKPKAGWKITDSYYDRSLDDIRYTRTHPNIANYPFGGAAVRETRYLRDVNRDGNYAKGGHLGVYLQKSFGSWSVSNKARYQSYAHGTKFNLGISATYTDAPGTQVRLLVDGDGTDTDFINELRLDKKWRLGHTQHHFTVGNYASLGLYAANTWGLTGWMLPDKNNLFLGSFGAPPTPFRLTPPTAAAASRIDKYRVAITSFFAGDEIKIGDKYLLNIGVRNDAIKMDLSGFYPDTINEMKRREKHGDWSVSLGMNYKLNERSALYGNVMRSYRMPDYDLYSAVNKASYWWNTTTVNGVRTTIPITKPRIANNEIVYNGEAGYRTGIGDWGIDVAGFYTQIANRLVTVYEGAIAVSKPLGNNQIVGTEVSLTYAPSAVPGLLLVTSYTYQRGTFSEFKIPVRSALLSTDASALYGLKLVDDPAKGGINGKAIDVKGNQLPGLPSGIWNFDLNYDRQYISLNLNSNRNTGFYQDALNLFKRDAAIWYLNMGAYVKWDVGWKMPLKIGVLVKNVLNTDIAERMLYNLDSDANLLLKQRLELPASDARRLNPETTYFAGTPVLPRRVLLTMEYKF